MTDYTILVGDVMTRLAEIPDKSVRTCITSPPYWGLRDYGAEGQLGLEPTPEQYVENLVAVFRQVKRVLTDDGTLWLNLGDSYAGSGKGGNPEGSRWSGFVGNKDREKSAQASKPIIPDGLKPKDLVGIPWRVAFALQADGWYLRQDIIWAKPNPMPESVRDRCTKSHEYVFMLSKSPRYYFDSDAIKEPLAESSLKRIEQATFDTQTGGEKDYGNTGVNPNRSARKTLENFAASVKMPPIGGKKQTENGNPTYSGNQPDFKPLRNKRDVWTIPTKPFKGAHFAVMPEALVEPCVLAGSSEWGACVECSTAWTRVLERPQPPQVESSELDRYGNGEAGVHRKVGQAYQNWLNENPAQTVGWKKNCECLTHEVKPDLVLDPFTGSGTVAVVALKHGRSFVGTELNPDYAAIAEQRIAAVPPTLDFQGGAA